MWTEKSLKEKIIKNNNFNLGGALTKLLPLALDITEDPKKMPYAFTEISSDPISRVQVEAFSSGDLPSELTVQNYHAMLKYLNGNLNKKDFSDVEFQKRQGFRLMIDFDNGGRPRDSSNIFRIYTSVRHTAYCLSLTFDSIGYEAVSGVSKIRLQERCEDFMGPNKRTFT